MDEHKHEWHETKFGRTWICECGLLSHTDPAGPGGPACLGLLPPDEPPSDIPAFAAGLKAHLASQRSADIEALITRMAALGRGEINDFSLAAKLLYNLSRIDAAIDAFAAEFQKR